MTRPIFGSDPEFFISKNKEIRAASELFPGKNDKMFLAEISKDSKIENCEVFYDGIQAEINLPPSESIKEHLDIFKRVFKALNSFVKKKGYSIIIAPAVKVTENTLKSAPKDALMFGCDVDFDAYTCAPNPKPSLDPKTTTLRTAGGHVHFGVSHIPELKEKILDLNIVDFVKLVDIILGIPCVLIDRNLKTDT